jgi:hypothetical protein
MIIDWIKNLFTKRSEVKPNKPRELNSNELWLLDRLKYDEVYTSEKGKTYYLVDGTHIEVLGKYSYPDVDMTKSGWVCKNIDTGELIDLPYTRLGNLVLFYNRKPHEWVKELSTNDQSHYKHASNYLSDEELDKAYSDKIKIYLRNQKLKDLGI